MDEDEITFGNTLPPERFLVIDGRYRLLERLGVGGMGEVFSAVHLHTGQEVAIKRMYHFVDPQGVERFQQEARTATRVEHPGVVEVIDAGRSDDGIWYLVMERLDGLPLDTWMQTRPTAERLAKIRALLDPLEAVHGAGVVHRDLKPDNVFVLTDGRIKVIDFGIARDLQAEGLTRTGSTMGTPHYMSPEQAMDPRTCGPASDIWSVGVMLYVAVMERVPFEGDSFPAVCMQAIQNPHPPVTGVHPALAALIDRCMAKDPAERPADAGALRAAWDALPAEARAGALFDPSSVTPPGARRRWPLWVAGVAAAGLLAGAAAWQVTDRGSPTAPAQVTQATPAAAPSTADEIQPPPVVEPPPAPSPAPPESAPTPEVRPATPIVEPSAKRATRTRTQPRAARPTPARSAAKPTAAAKPAVPEKPAPPEPAAMAEATPAEPEPAEPEPTEAAPPEPEPAAPTVAAAPVEAEPAAEPAPPEAPPEAPKAAPAPPPFTTF